ncbi:MAG: virulence protein RhuM/Fic/DOC family protein [Lachnospiraceae bacterium]|nr:virulence protein RhuM/Fic/DOC family protein [Lachnospiraceae bacterium]
MKNEIVLFRDGNINLEVPISPEEDTVWLSQAQMVELYGRDVSVISRHINNVFKEGEVEKESNLQFLQIANSDRPVAFYSLDVIISVGYRVKSKRGIAFRKWANRVLKNYILQGYAVNETRLKQLGDVVRLMRRTQDSLDSRQVLSVVESYSTALDLLDAYDHQNMKRPKGTGAAYVLTYEECRKVIDQMRFGDESDLFGREKDGSFKGSIGNIYQSFGGVEIYPSLEEKAANLLYFVTKNHSFWDGNKRIAATMFLYFLDRNGVLYDENGDNLLDDHTLVALTIMIAESRPEEKEMMVSGIMNCLV